MADAKTIKRAALFLAGTTAVTTAAVKFVHWLNRPQALPGAPVAREVITSPSPPRPVETTSPPRPIETAQAPRGSRRGLHFIPTPMAEPAPVVEPWMEDFARQVSEGIKARRAAQRS